MELDFELKTGIKYAGDTHKRVSLLPTNGIAEEVVLAKSYEKPFTYLGNVATICIDAIGEIPIGDEARETYLRKNKVDIHPAILAAPLAEFNVIMAEIHRRVWKAVVPQQMIICMKCGDRVLMDVELDKLKYEESEEPYNRTPEFLISVRLPKGWTFKAPKDEEGKKKLPECDGVTFNLFTFRVPLLRDAIKHEGYSDQEAKFWREIAYECLVRIDAVDEAGNVVVEFPVEQAKAFYGSKLFSLQIQRDDLVAIRQAVESSLPSMPLIYSDECPCPRKEEIPVTMGVSSFFGE